jgi:hypothetical protein
MACSMSFFSTRAIAVSRSRILPSSGGIDGRLPHRRLVDPVLAHDASTRGIPDFKGPALAHSSHPSAPFAAVTQVSRLHEPLALQPFVATLSDSFRVTPCRPLVFHAISRWGYGHSGRKSRALVEGGGGSRVHLAMKIVPGGFLGASTALLERTGGGKPHHDAVAS